MAIVSSLIGQQPDADGARTALEENDRATSRVTPVVPPCWLEQLGDGIPDLRPPKSATEEDVFWSTPPRYSLLVSLAPESLAAPTPARHVWGARLLFALISCAILALVALELRKLDARAPLTGTGAVSSVTSDSGK